MFLEQTLLCYIQFYLIYFLEKDRVVENPNWFFSALPSLEFESGQPNEVAWNDRLLGSSGAFLDLIVLKLNALE